MERVVKDHDGGVVFFVNFHESPVSLHGKRGIPVLPGGVTVIFLVTYIVAGEYHFTPVFPAGMVFILGPHERFVLIGKFIIIHDSRSGDDLVGVAVG